MLTLSAPAQVPKNTEESPAAAPAKEELSPAPAKVDISPVARDEEIRQRLQNILEATGWFTSPAVRVQNGVIFLKGQAPSAELKKWAGDLARNTQDAVAVANSMEVPGPPVWDLSPAWRGLLTLWRDFVRMLPFMVFGLIVLALSAGIALLTVRITKALLKDRIQAGLLRNVVAGAAGAVIFLFGVYVVLRVSGLTQLALTVIGGTGLIGLAMGIAFRDITENFLASVFLSMQQPFGKGDLVEVSGVTGYVQQLNVRTTILMTLNGNLVQIPNAAVYKSNIRNFTANPSRREDFVIGIGYNDAIDHAQETARQVLRDHPAVLKDPEPSVLADSLGNATVNLRVYFWINGREHSWLKVRSSVIRLVKLAYQKNGISMPDEAREVVFPQGIPVTILKAEPERAEEPSSEVARLPGSPEEVATRAEGGLASEAVTIEEQARQAQSLQGKENLLKAENPLRDEADKK
ncbi:MAG: mechanosensitive ion channel [Verrucomicrobiaceae bacterium]|nr:MAG: mechanosensitive ion channel [Verrucomicrobiaceae bacterium]